ncbi:MAG: 2-hydroxyglutaryl-CoA dehydratase [Deltaproteobacteria bacterium]|nr:2-hydroxyglutaryl-CoA dehydratase [Deltaproteobacteria bacterium]
MVSGLSLAHDELGAQALMGIGYQVVVLGEPDQASLQFGKEFGNRGQCNPTHFTVGNLVKHLIQLRDEQHVPTKEIIEKYVFLTAGGCGPCRFGMYVTEYRKALRDAGFDGFRVLLFQMAGGVRQATGEELGLKIDGTFAWAIVRALIAGDVLNQLAYRLRPYEVEPGATDRAMAEAKLVVGDFFRRRASVTLAMLKARRIFGRVKLDRTRPKPVVSLIGEFWAMTTEGAGNYHMQRFLEREGAEVRIQGITNWLLFLVWEAGHDTKNRMTLREEDTARKGLAGKGDPIKKLVGLKAADKAIRGFFTVYANAAGLHGHEFPSMDELARISKDHYNNDVRGGEGHLEVGEAIHFVEHKINHMTLSVKPFGCMPSSGVSDGVQSLVMAKWPEALILCVETTGDQEVNAHSRVQMMLFKARQKAQAEFDAALAKAGLSEETFREKVAKSWRFSGNFFRPRHRMAGSATNLVYAVS